MRIELIQPFINATDAVLADMLQGPVEVSQVVMEEHAYRRQGVAASVAFHGDIEGRIIFDLEGKAAAEVARALTGDSGEALEQIAGETVCELANMIVGNAVTLLNDQGHRFKVLPPELHTAEHGYSATPQSEALVMCFNTPGGKVHLNVALDYSRQRAPLSV